MCTPLQPTQVSQKNPREEYELAAVRIKETLFTFHSFLIATLHLVPQPS